ncbi:hypothetical protein [Paenibacillus sp. L3-i20]|uniref:hypothetical protein n=1 Tax=Paenibacillus sp. L3-i20 TaxID=2905833 RepID=UPI001EDCAC57|nr:hypothetical protein [Paenibacillus sp. L3-i20]GKU77837.1 hypothetical protein L3i20_v222340 [Paenibacillus sp. L3-i20]
MAKYFGDMLPFKMDKGVQRGILFLFSLWILEGADKSEVNALKGEFNFSGDPNMQAFLYAMWEPFVFKMVVG